MWRWVRQIVILVLHSHNGLQVFCTSGNLWVFSCENEAGGYSTVYQSVWLRLEDAWNKLVGWGRGGGWGSAVFPKTKGSAELQYDSLSLLPCIKLLSTDLDHLSCYLPHPCFSITQSSTSCCQWRAAFMNKLKSPPVIKRHGLNNYAEENFEESWASAHLHFLLK